MKNILVGVGGTGTKILEAMVYLSVFGAPDMARRVGDELLEGQNNKLKKKARKALKLRDHVNAVTVRVVDPDGRNDILGRVNDLLDCFRNDGEGINLNDIFSGGKVWKPTKIEAAAKAELRWDNPHEGTIERTFSGTDPKNIRSLFYNRDDRTIVDLNDGCWGRPRIGTLALTYGFNKDYHNADGSLRRNPEGFWPKMIEPAEFNQGVKLMFAGSIFGGTGASVIKNLAKAFTEKMEDRDKCGIGMLFMLPYFAYNDDALEGGRGAKSKNFPMNAKLALAYYSDKIFDKLERVSPVVYLGGGDPNARMYMDDRQTPAKVSKSGKDQGNPAMPADLAAALSMLHFYVTPTDDIDHAGSVYSPFEKENLLPYHEMCETVLNRMDLFCDLWLTARGRLLDGKLADAPFTHLQITSDNADDCWNQYLSKVDNFVDAADTWLNQLRANGLGNYITIARKNDLAWYLTKWRDEVAGAKYKADSEELFKALVHSLMSICKKHIREGKR